MRCKLITISLGLASVKHHQTQESQRLCWRFASRPLSCCHCHCSVCEKKRPVHHWSGTCKTVACGSVTSVAHEVIRGMVFVILQTPCTDLMPGSVVYRCAFQDVFWKDGYVFSSSFPQPSARAAAPPPAESDDEVPIPRFSYHTAILIPYFRIIVMLRFLSRAPVCLAFPPPLLLFALNPPCRLAADALSGEFRFASSSSSSSL
jgi:hypothetical protein